MANVKVRNWNNDEVRSLELPDRVFGCDFNESIVHEVVRAHLAARRAGTHATKTRGLVAGSGRKLWKQKHTGRARIGSVRSPLWRKGGTVHGPQPRDYTFKVNVKVKKGALRSALSQKLASSRLVILEKMEPEETKTKWLEKALVGLGIEGKALLVDSLLNENLERVARNNPRLAMVDASHVNVYDVMNADYLVFSEDAVNRVTEVLQ